MRRNEKDVQNTVTHSTSDIVGGTWSRVHNVKTALTLSGINPEKIAMLGCYYMTRSFNYE